MGAGLIVSETEPVKDNRYTWYKPSTKRWSELVGDTWTEVIQESIIDVEALIAAHAALPNAHHPANVGISGSKVVGGFRLTFTDGLLTGFVAV